MAPYAPRSIKGMPHSVQRRAQRQRSAMAAERLLRAVWATRAGICAQMPAICWCRIWRGTPFVTAEPRALWPCRMVTYPRSWKAADAPCSASTTMIGPRRALQGPVGLTDPAPSQLWVEVGLTAGPVPIRLPVAAWLAGVDDADPLLAQPDCLCAHAPPSHIAVKSRTLAPPADGPTSEGVA